MDARQERGKQIALAGNIVKTPVGWKVPSQSGKGAYVVSLGDKPFCTCADFEARQLPCKHILAVEYSLRTESRPDGTTIVTKTVKVTYGQDWGIYNDVQTHEQERFVALLRDLCSTIPQPPQSFDRPRLPLSDVVFGAAFKVYSTMSGRRVMPEIREAQVKGLMSRAPSFTSTFRYLENPELTPLLKALIEQTAMPLRSIETDFAVDSSGFATTTYNRWFDAKYGKEKSRQIWVKTHLMCGVNTHIVTSVEATPYESADSVQFPSLVSQTAESFDVHEVSADKAYSTNRNLQVVAGIGGTAFIPFKSFSTGRQGHHNYDSLWQRMWHYYTNNRATFLEHYHKRSNAETTFSMIKAKFGGYVRSKTPTAQVNEVLCKVLCHNICVIIQSIAELGIEATFGTEMAPVPEVVWN